MSSEEWKLVMLRRGVNSDLRRHTEPIEALCVDPPFLSSFVSAPPGTVEVGYHRATPDEESEE